MSEQGISYQAMPGMYGNGNDGLLAAALLSRNDRGYDRGYDHAGCLMSAIESTDDHVVAHMGQTANQTQTLASQSANETLTLANQLCGAADGISTKLAGAANNLREGIHSAEARLQQDIFATSGRVSDGFHRQSNELCAGFSRTNEHISNFERGTEKNFSDVLVAIKESQYNTAIAIRDDGDKTRGLVSRQYEDTLNRDLTIARDEIIELRNESRIDRRGRETEVNVTQTVNQTQAQAQAQQQFQVLANLAAQVQNLANDVQVVRQTQSNVNFGVQAGTAQTAGATNNRVS